MSTSELGSYERDWSARTCLVGDPGNPRPLGHSLEYARRLLDTGRPPDAERAARIIEAVCALQRLEPSWKFGQIPMRADLQTHDRNSNLFFLPEMAEILRRHGPRLPQPAGKRLRDCFRRAMSFAERRWDEEVFDLHRDGKAYTNIFLLYVRAMVLGGVVECEERLWRKGEAQWQRWFNHISYYGIDEFCSPTYSHVDFEALTHLLRIARDEAMKGEVRMALDYLFAMQFAATHPVLEVPVCGSGRDYRRYWSPREGRPLLLGAADPGGYVVPEALREEFANRKFPFEMSGRATAVPFRFRSRQEEGAGLGTLTGGHYFPQNIHCAAAVGRSSAERELLCLPGRHCFQSGFTAQDGLQALCFFTQAPNSYVRTQYIRPDTAHAKLHGDWPLVVGVTAGWEEVERKAGRLTLRAYDRDLHLRPFALVEDKAKPVELTRARMSGYHRDIDVYTFPPEAKQVLCLVAITAAGKKYAPSTPSAKRRDSVLELSSGKLALRLFEHPTGELTELYEEDWRTTPLLRAPALELRPGGLTARAANEFAAVRKVDTY
jgi:hypothetical protein